MTKNLWLIVAFLAVLAVPLVLRQTGGGSEAADRTLVIITPHNEATRFEFERAFRDYYFKKTGRTVRIDWRTPGGTSEIARYLASEYLAVFQNRWTNQLHRPWSAAVESAFDNFKAAPDDPARRAFLESGTGCGIDLFFGGGVYDLSQQAAAGRLVDCGVITAHPEWFNAKGIPQNLGGEAYWDPKGRWIGTCLSAYGICYNPDALTRLGIGTPPAQWRDLASPLYFGQIALADPTQSGSVAKVFEMMIQQQMAQNPESPGAKEEGWTNALRLIQKISANARYFTDSAAKIPYDVEAGDAAAGMCIDFYGRFQSEAVRKPDGSSRLQYVSPAGGSSVSADPIGMLRGAPHQELAREFIEFVMSVDGQKLWNWKAGTPGGPVKYALRRLPIRRELYTPEFRPFRSDPEVDPYAQAGSFVYHEDWTSPLFRPISFIVRAMCIDPHGELRAAWRDLAAAGFPAEAMVVFSDVSKVDYAAASGPIREALRSGKKIDQIKLARGLSDTFRTQYNRASEMARKTRKPGDEIRN
jgi:ABC-type Fe3+ transport system substrate-binding protein